MTLARLSKMSRMCIALHVWSDYTVTWRGRTALYVMLVIMTRSPGCSSVFAKIVFTAAVALTMGAMSCG